MISAIIVDDEIKSRQTLGVIVSKYCSAVTIINEAGNTDDAYTIIREQRPDLVFLDVSMPYEDGFELLKRVGDVFFETVFTTAYEQYAVRAIKACAVDFLLKPLNIAEVVEAVDKAQRNIAKKQHNISLEHLLHNLNAKKTGHNKIAVPTGAGLDFIALEDIIRIEAEGNYTQIFLSGSRKIISTRNLKEYEDLLPDDNFFRAHHSHIINLSYIATYYRGEGGYVKMKDGSSVDIAKRKKRDFLAFFGI